MDDVSISFIANDAPSKLLERPFSRRMTCDVEMKDAPSCDFDDGEDVDQLERSRYHNEEVAGNDPFGMIPHECHPALFRICRTLRHFRHVASNGTRRNSNADFE